MIRVTMLRSAGKPVGFDCTGHADYADAGEDIVCSAVSAVTQTALIGITEILKIQAGVSVGGDGIHCILARDTSREQCEQAALLFDTMEAGLRSIAESYHGTLKIMDREV